MMPKHPSMFKSSFPERDEPLGSLLPLPGNLLYCMYYACTTERLDLQL